MFYQYIISNIFFQKEFLYYSFSISSVLLFLLSPLGTSVVCILDLLDHSSISVTFFQILFFSPSSKIFKNIFLCLTDFLSGTTVQFICSYFLSRIFFIS